MITFILVNNDAVILKKYSVEKITKIIDIKTNILNDYYQGKGYLDLNFLLEKTKRTFGKFNLDPGVMPRTLDNRTLENFGLEDDIIKIKVEKHTNENIQINLENKKLSSSCEGKYIPPNRQKIKKNEEKEFTFKEDDFPSL